MVEPPTNDWSTTPHARFEALTVECNSNKQGVRATDRAPESAQVDLVQIPFNPNRPYYVVTVEPFQIAADGSGAPTAP